MSEKTKARLHKINFWCLEHSADFFTNLIRDMKSVKALFNYLFMALYTWVAYHLTRHHAETCGNTMIITTGGVVASIFTNYVWGTNAEKKAARKFPAYSNPDDPALPAPAEPGDDGNG